MKSGLNSGFLRVFLFLSLYIASFQAWQKPTCFTK
nr:MAG TPA: hypothetical protein [Caudoviricetes sp.]DAU34300.1 MAG TPA: hypothetical protein [Caudoviricetes sp.]